MNNKGSQPYKVPNSASAEVKAPNQQSSGKAPKVVKGGDLRARGSK